ncbi:MAG: hypothetical protein GDA67_13625 [Nitrospira sp. CR1.3]|nr:hypothetical protein [Nitrospira sp. CR1.3]
MRIRKDRTVVVVALLGMLIGGCASEGTTSSGGGAASGSGASAGATSGSASSSGSAGGAAAQPDSLQACLAKIPPSATAGTRQVAEESCKRDEAVRAGIVGAASTKSNDRAASGTQGDTLEACMARIPKDASAGQKMLAEQSCRRDQANR